MATGFAVWIAVPEGQTRKHQAQAAFGFRRFVVHFLSQNLASNLEPFVRSARREVFAAQRGSNVGATARARRPRGGRGGARRSAMEEEGAVEGGVAAAGVGATPAPANVRVTPTLEEDTRVRREIGALAVWSVTSAKPGNGVELLRDDNLDTYWQSDGAQPHLVNIQFQRKVRPIVGGKSGGGAMRGGGRRRCELRPLHARTHTHTLTHSHTQQTRSRARAPTCARLPRRA